MITVGKVFKRIFSEADRWDDDSDKWHIKISGVDEVSSEKITKKYLDKQKEAAIINLTGTRDGKSESRGFTITDPLTVSIYAIGEGYKYASVFRVPNKSIAFRSFSFSSVLDNLWFIKIKQHS